MQLTLMDIDASQYASISREMLENNSFLQVYDLGVDYLDKPPMLFWLSALSMKIFGINHFAYRLPSFIFALLAIYATSRLTLLYYKKEVAVFAALILASCQAMFLILHDVRTDTMLMGWVIISIWQLAQWNETKKIRHFVIGCIAIAGGMMTKGPIALIVPIAAFVPHWILKREWKAFFRWEYLVGIVLIAICLLPMSIGLYQQFDMHPEKTVNNQTGVSGLRFFYWTQSFGRITGESTWREYGYFSFLMQNMLWSFLPWIFFFLIALVSSVHQLTNQRFILYKKQEWMSTGGFIITYCLLGSSQAQLPHYIFIAFPFAAIITANFLYALLYENRYRKLSKFLYIFHAILYALLWITIVVLLWWAFPQTPKLLPILAFIAFGATLYIHFSKKVPLPRLFLLSFFTITGINLFLNTGLYPQLLKYQAGSEVGRFVLEKNLPKERVVLHNFPVGRSMHFYGKSIYRTSDSLNQLRKGDIILTSEDRIPTLGSASFKPTILFKGQDYHISTLDLKFINPKRRGGETKKYVLARID
ncbi:MAG TPA: glycosyltransferase family 39 protein [Segetibacter sp.]